MDCWVVQLGVVTAEHDAVSHATSLRVDAKTGRAVISSDPTLGDHEISPFVVDMENEGRLSERGRFRTDRDDLRLLVEHHRSEEHTSELQSLMRISYAVFCLKKKKITHHSKYNYTH